MQHTIFLTTVLRAISPTFTKTFPIVTNTRNKNHVSEAGSFRNVVFCFRILVTMRKVLVKAADVTREITVFIQNQTRHCVRKIDSFIRIYLLTYDLLTKARFLRLRSVES